MVCVKSISAAHSVYTLSLIYNNGGKILSYFQ